MSTCSIVDTVRGRLDAEHEALDLMFSPEHASALRLAETFGELTPDTYVLPLNAMISTRLQDGDRVMFSAL